MFCTSTNAFFVWFSIIVIPRQFFSNQTNTKFCFRQHVALWFLAVLLKIVKVNGRKLSASEGKKCLI